MSLNTLKVQNIELFSKMKQQRVEVDRLRVQVEAGRVTTLLLEAAQSQLTQALTRLGATIEGDLAAQLSRLSARLGEVPPSQGSSLSQRVEGLQAEVARLGGREQRLVELEDLLEREERTTQRLQLLLARRPAVEEDAKDEAKEEGKAESKEAPPPAPPQGRVLREEDAERLLAEMAALQDVASLRDQALSAAREQQRALQAALHEQEQRALAEAEVEQRSAGAWRATEQRAEVAEAAVGALRAELEQAQSEMHSLRSQRNHDQEQRGRLHQAQLVQQEEKVQAMEGRLRKLQAEKDQLALALEARQREAAAGPLLRQLGEQVAQAELRLAEEREAKAACLERIAELRRGRPDPRAEGEEALLKEMAAMERELVAVQGAHAKTSKQLAEAEQGALALAQERLALQRVQQLAAKKESMLADRLTRLEEKAKLQEAALLAGKEQRLALEAQLKAQQALTRDQTLIAATHEGTARELSLLVPQLGARLEAQAAELGVARLKVREEQEKVLVAQERAQTAQEEAATTRRRLELAQSRGATQGGSSTGGARDEQLEYYKKLVRCSVCADRPKGAIITRCFHMFCRPCIDENLAARHRKCPACSVSFGEKDVHSVWL